MIMRIYRCTVLAGRERQFRDWAFKKGHPSLQERPGLIAFYAGRPLPESGDRTRCMTQIWKDLSSIQAAYGDNWEEPLKILPEEARAFIDSASVEHYELADEFRTEQQA